MAMETLSEAILLASVRSSDERVDTPWFIERATTAKHRPHNQAHQQSLFLFRKTALTRECSTLSILFTT
jgi:hypothetical protein